MTWVNEIVQSLSGQLKITINCIYMVIDDNWTHFPVFFNSGHKGLILKIRFIFFVDMLIDTGQKCYEIFYRIVILRNSVLMNEFVLSATRT